MKTNKKEQKQTVGNKKRIKFKLYGHTKRKTRTEHYAITNLFGLAVTYNQQGDILETIEEYL